MMDLLGISTLRPGPSGNPQAPNAANSDESKVPPSTLPDPLVRRAGGRVTDPEQWWRLRRPEIVEDFDREVYGRVPDDVPGVTWEVASTRRARWTATSRRVVKTARRPRRQLGVPGDRRSPST